MEHEEITLLAQGENQETFNVTFARNDGKLTITCSCPAGRHGEFCEHKFRLAANDIMMLAMPGQNSAMLSAHIWVIESTISDSLLRLLTLVNDEKSDEKAIEEAKAEVGTAMREGTPANM